MTAIKAAMTWDEAAFGREYDLVGWARGAAPNFLPAEWLIATGGFHQWLNTIHKPFVTAGVIPRDSSIGTSCH